MACLQDDLSKKKQFPVDVRIGRQDSTVTVTSFTVLPKSEVTEQWQKHIDKLNKQPGDGYYACVDNETQLLVKYIQRLVMCDASSKKIDGALKRAVGDGFIHTRVAVSYLLKGGEC